MVYVVPKRETQDFLLGKLNISTSLGSYRAPVIRGKKNLLGLLRGKHRNSVADAPEKISLWSDGCLSSPGS